MVLFPVVKAASIQGSVFIDANGDGIVQEAEEPLEGIAVVLSTTEPGTPPAGGVGDGSAGSRRRRPTEPGTPPEGGWATAGRPRVRHSVSTPMVDTPEVPMRAA